MAKYIIDKRLLFKKGRQRKLLIEIKTKFHTSWHRIAKVVGLSTQTVRVAWAQEKTTIPYSSLNRLLEVYPIMKIEYVLSNYVNKELPPKWGQIKGGHNSIAKADRSLPITL
ncbi:MAG: hypothetical protein KGH49_04260, partial [Candidatus Micrarchaeota archaeon]|nr:hypothetical protein [Candidatus Micrarchaeota archaeon]